MDKRLVKTQSVSQNEKTPRAPKTFKINDLQIRCTLHEKPTGTPNSDDIEVVIAECSKNAAK